MRDPLHRPQQQAVTGEAPLCPQDAAILEYTGSRSLDYLRRVADRGDPERTRRTIAAIQQEGTCWCGGTVWQGHTAMRISVSNWRTTDEDIERSLEAILRTAAQCAS